jgi:hypothetical protein
MFAILAVLGSRNLEYKTKRKNGRKKIVSVSKDWDKRLRKRSEPIHN